VIVPDPDSDAVKAIKAGRPQQHDAEVAAGTYATTPLINNHPEPRGQL
jgi:hypothetical protein